MRDTASTSGAEVGQIPGGERVLVLDGPVCADGFAWWEVDYNGVIGWTVEGSGADYWVLPVPAADLIFASEGNGESVIFSVHVQGDHLARLGEPDAYLSNPTVSPDGTRIAYLGLMPDGTGFLGVMGIDGGNPIVLSSGDQYGYAETIAWSPDSTRIVFVMDADLGADADHMNLYMVNADGSNLHALTTNTAEHARPAWSPTSDQMSSWPITMASRPIFSSCKWRTARFASSRPMTKPLAIQRGRQMARQLGLSPSCQGPL